MIDRKDVDAIVGDLMIRIIKYSRQKTFEDKILHAVEISTRLDLLVSENLNQSIKIEELNRRLQDSEFLLRNLERNSLEHTLEIENATLSQEF